MKRQRAWGRSAFCVGDLVVASPRAFAAGSVAWAWLYLVPAQRVISGAPEANAVRAADQLHLPNSTTISSVCNRNSSPWMLVAAIKVDIEVWWFAVSVTNTAKVTLVHESYFMRLYSQG